MDRTDAGGSNGDDGVRPIGWYIAAALIVSALMWWGLIAGVKALVG
jgi:hypothetical protein